MKDRKITKRFTYEEENNGVVWTALGSANLVTDMNYGADADGHRGVQMSFIEDVEVGDFEKDGISVADAEVPEGIKEALLNVANEDNDDWDGQSDEDARADEGDRKFHELRDEGKI